MFLKPSDIYYCQDSISNIFSTGQNVGETLDDICEGRCHEVINLLKAQYAVKKTPVLCKPHFGYQISVVLPERAEISLSSFPKIQVMRKDSKWFTTDNRRLWVIKHLHRLGKCGEIPVIEIGQISSDKMTTKNGGVDVKVRGRVFGRWWLKPNGAGSNPSGKYDCSWPENSVGVYLPSYRDFESDSDEYFMDDSDSDFLF